MNATDLKQIDELLQKRLQGFATKDDLKSFATKDDLKQELKNFATKDDLAVMKKELIEHIEEGEIAIINGVEKYVVKRLEVLENRVEKVEHQLQQA